MMRDAFLSEAARQYDNGEICCKCGKPQEPPYRGRPYCCAACVVKADTARNAPLVNPHTGAAIPPSGEHTPPKCEPKPLMLSSPAYPHLMAIYNQITRGQICWDCGSTICDNDGVAGKPVSCEPCKVASRPVFSEGGLADLFVETAREIGESVSGMLDAPPLETLDKQRAEQIVEGILSLKKDEVKVSGWATHSAEQIAGKSPQEIAEIQLGRKVEQPKPSWSAPVEQLQTRQVYQGMSAAEIGKHIAMCTSDVSTREKMEAILGEQPDTIASEYDKFQESKQAALQKMISNGECCCKCYKWVPEPYCGEPVLCGSCQAADLEASLRELEQTDRMETIMIHPRTHNKMLSNAAYTTYQAVMVYEGKRLWLTYHLPGEQHGELEGYTILPTDWPKGPAEPLQLNVCEINRIWPSESDHVLGVYFKDCDRWSIANREGGNITQIQICDYEGRVREVLQVLNPRRLYDYGS